MKLSIVATSSGDLQVNASYGYGGKAALKFGETTVFVEQDDIPELVSELQKTYFVLCNNQDKNYEVVVQGA